MASPVTPDTRPQPTQTSVDGVPVFWTEGPEPFTGGLVFRVGRADETLAAGGLTHLVEHLTLYPLGRQPYEYNGVIEENVTIFWATGRRHEVLDFLMRCAKQLADLPLDRLEDEKKVLEVEAVGAGGLYADLLSYRYGASGYGLMAFHELGLRSFEDQDVVDWTTRFFTRGNVVAWLTGPPDGLSLPLPDGPRHPAPTPEPLSGLTLPAQSWHRTSAVAVTFEGQRSAALNAGFAIAADRIHEQLRREAGVTYSPGGAYHPLTGDRAHLMLSSDCAETNAAPVRDGLLSIVDDLAERGPTQAELDWNRSMVVRAFSDPRALLGQLDSFARRELIGGAPIDDETLVREFDSLTPRVVADAISEVMPAMLVSSPTGTPRSQRADLSDYAADPATPVPGTHFPADEKWRSLQVFDDLTIGSAGVTYRPRPGADGLTIHFEDCVAAIEGQESSLTLVSRTGSSVRLAPERSKDGVLALDTVRRALPAEIFVPMDEAAATVEAVAREKLSDDRRSPLGDDLDALAKLLSPGEQLITLAEAKRARFQGLLATTDRRLMFIFTGSEEDFREVPLESAGNVSAKGLPKRRLTLTAAGEHLEFADIWPRQRLAEIVEQLGG